MSRRANCQFWGSIVGEGIPGWNDPMSSITLFISQRSCGSRHLSFPSSWEILTLQKNPILPQASFDWVSVKWLQLINVHAYTRIKTLSVVLLSFWALLSFGSNSSCCSEVPQKAQGYCNPELWDSCLPPSLLLQTRLLSSVVTESECLCGCYWVFNLSL